MTQSEPVREMSVSEATTFLNSRHFGRMAVAIGDEPLIFPVNYAYVDESTGASVAGAPAALGVSGRLYIRSAPGDKLFAAAVEKRVVFEVDRVEPDEAISVIAAGKARVVTNAQELDHVEALDLKPWVATHRAGVISIDVDRLTGRQFVFGVEPDATVIEPSS